MLTSRHRSDGHATPASGLDVMATGSPSGPALVIESDPTVQRDLARLLTRLGYEAMMVQSVADARSILEQNRCAFTVLDLNIEGNEGNAFLRRLRSHAAEAGPVIAVARDEMIPAEASSLGVVACIRKPVTQGDLENAIKSAMPRSRHGGAPASDDPRARLEEELALCGSPRMREIRSTIKLISGPDVTVLVRGETGTGKDVVARSIHYQSARRARPFIKVNCAALPRDLLESELFGHERGAFTGAHELKIGKFELANQGTMFLDEIGDLHPDLQGKLLHVLQDGQFSRVGGRTTIKVDVRVLAATNQDLERNVAAGTFREDLFYRLNVIQITVPPLRDRPEEIPTLAQYFVHRYCQRFQREPFTLTPDTLRKLMQQRYAGNVRELENIVKRMIVLDDPFLLKNGVATATPTPTEEPPPAKLATVSLKDIGRRAAQQAERAAILQMLEQTRWNRLRAARQLNISYRALLYKMKEGGIGLDPAAANGHE
jgi:two-component system, NtrC family, response regulator AtoC